MKIYIVISVFNEGAILANALQSFVNQSRPPDKILIVNDNSTDNSQSIIDNFVAKHNSITSYLHKSNTYHKPGSKVINAFYAGLEKLDDSFDLIGKFDADIILPIDYFEKVVSIFSVDHSVGVAGGGFYI